MDLKLKEALDHAEKAYFACDFEKALNKFLALRKQGVKEASYFLGLMYLMGMGYVPEDEKEAEILFRESISRECPYAWMELTGESLLEMKEGNEALYEEGMKKISEEAGMGNVTALFELGNHYLKDASQKEGTEEDMKKGLDLIQKSSDKGYFLASWMLGKLYSLGMTDKEGNEEKREENDKKAYGEFLKAAGAGYGPAEMELGECYYHGRGVEKSTEKALILYKKALQHGDLSAAEVLGVMHLLGDGVKADRKKAFSYFKRASHSRNPDTFLKLGDCYYYGWGTKQDFAKAFDLYMEAWDKGSPKAAGRIGKMYLAGEGVPKDGDKAFQWLNIGREAGDHETFLYLGECYYEGMGVAKDENMARKFFLSSAANNNEAGMYRMGVWYLVPSHMNLERAALWLRKSAERGYTPAANQLAIMYIKGQGVTRNVKIALDWLAHSESAGDKNAAAIRETYLPEYSRIGQYHGKN